MSSYQDSKKENSVINLELNEVHPFTSTCNSVAPSSAKVREEEKRLEAVIFDINVQIAVFRDLLIHVGTSKDAPELREKIRRVRRHCVEGCKQTNTQLLPHIKSALSEGTIIDSHQLICIYLLSQLLERELDKCYRLVVAMPMNMDAFYDSKQPSHGLGNVLSQIVLGKSIKPDFNAEEKLSIEKDSREIRIIVSEMAEYLPKEDPDKARNNLTSGDNKRQHWAFHKKRRSRPFRPSTSNPADGNCRRHCMLHQVSPSSFCCLCSPPNYL